MIPHNLHPRTLRGMREIDAPLDVVAEMMSVDLEAMAKSYEREPVRGSAPGLRWAPRGNPRLSGRAAYVASGEFDAR